MNFFQTIKNSIYSPDFYKSIPKKPFKESFLYFLLLALILTTIHVLTFAGSLLINTSKAIQQLASETISCYPQDLEIRITNGVASSSAKEPYTIPPCEALASYEKNIVIDTTIPFSQEKFDEYNAAIWLSKTELVYRESKLETRSYSLSQIKDFTLNKQIIDSFYKKFTPIISFIGPMLVVLSFIGIYLSYILRLIYLIFFAVLVWVLSKLFKSVLSYGQAYKISLYATTLWLVLGIIIEIISRWTNIPNFPFMGTLVSLGVVIVNLFSSKQKS